MAAVGTLVVGVSGKYDVALAVLGMPVFLVAALMGHSRGGAGGVGDSTADGGAGPNPQEPA
jgi:hypothetical protein